MNNKEETTRSDATEPIVSWSGVQGETQSEDVEIPNDKEVLEEKVEPSSESPSQAGEQN